MTDRTRDLTTEKTSGGEHMEMRSSLQLTRSWLSAATRNWSTMLLIVVAASGASLGLYLLPSLPAEEWAGLLILAALAAALERWGTSLFSPTRVSVSAVAVLAAGILYGESAVVPIVVAVAAASWLFRGRPLSRLVFNGGQLMLAGVAAAAAYRGLSSVLPEGDVARMGAAAAGALAMWGVSSVLVSSMVAGTTGRPIRTVFAENFLWLGGHFAAMGLVGLGLALAWDELGVIGVVAFVAPLVAFAAALRQGAGKARRALREVRAARATISEQAKRLVEVSGALEEAVGVTSAGRVDAPSAQAGGALALYGRNVRPRE